MPVVPGAANIRLRLVRGAGTNIQNGAICENVVAADHGQEKP